MLFGKLQAYFVVVNLYIVALATPLNAAKVQSGRHSSKKYLSNSSRTKFNFKKFKYLVTFGDSYTSTYNDYDTMIGYRQYTNAAGPNWVYYLSDAICESRHANDTDVRVYNFASGGSVITEDVSTKYASEVLTFYQQIRDHFIPKMVERKKEFPWETKKTLFGIWFGINDTGRLRNELELKGKDLLNVGLYVYFRLIDELYQNGARHFIILNVPDLSFSPYVLESDGEGWMKRIDVFNKELPKFVAEFHRTHPDANVFFYDAFTEFGYIRKNYAKYGIEKVSDMCPDIWNPDETCLPVEKYYWANNLHPGVSVHKALTDDLVKFLTK
eukprot:jgi/Orpsp1_1/1178034/evm.model.c7180000063787.2